MSTAGAMTHEHPTGRHDRLLFHLAWGVTAAIFLSIGSMAMASLDPHGPVSILSHGNVPLLLLEVLALSAVTSAIATVLAGRAHPDIGAFAVGIGLALVAIQGANMTYLLMGKGAGRGLCLLLAVDGLFWFAVAALSMFTSAVVVRWVGGSEPAGKEDGDSPALSARVVLSQMAAPATPGVGRLLFGKGTTQEGGQWRTGLKHLAVATVVTLILIAVFSAGRGDRAIRHGQACFAVAAAFRIGVGRAHAFFPMRSSFWSCCSVPVVCVAAFLFSWILSSPSILVGDLASVPASNYLRILPITYIAVGVPAALWAHWRSLQHRAAPAGG